MSFQRSKIFFHKEDFIKEVMEDVRKQDTSKIPISSLFLKKKHYKFTYIPSTSFNNYVHSFNKLLALDEQFNDEDKAFLLLSLPDYYEQLNITLLHGKDKVSFYEICMSLHSYKS